MRQSLCFVRLFTLYQELVWTLRICWHEQIVALGVCSWEAAETISFISCCGTSWRLATVAVMRCSLRHRHLAFSYGVQMRGKATIYPRSCKQSLLSHVYVFTGLCDVC